MIILSYTICRVSPRGIVVMSDPTPNSLMEHTNSKRVHTIPSPADDDLKKLEDFREVVSPRRFFTVGRVFKALWTEPPQVSKEKAFKVRIFVVMREECYPHAASSHILNKKADKARIDPHQQSLAEAGAYTIPGGIADYTDDARSIAGLCSAKIS